MKEFSSVKGSEKAKKPKGKEFLEKFADSILKPRARTPGGSELPRNLSGRFPTFPALFLIEFRFQVTQEEIDFVREFNKLSDAEKKKYLKTLTQEQRDALMKLSQDYIK